MEEKTPEPLEELVERSRAGDVRAAERLMPVVYEELRRIAGSYMRREKKGQTIQPTALVHEAYLRLLKDKKQDWQGRTHFLAVAATSMRQILVERARARRAAKRGGGRDRVTLDEATFRGGTTGPDDTSLDLLAVDEALARLAQLDSQQAKIVELRFFGGLTIEETASALDVSPATIKRQWTVAKAWLRREIVDAAGDSGHGGARGGAGSGP